MRVILTGATGFIGKPALALLLRQEHEVLSLARQPLPTISGHFNNQLSWHQCDLANPSSWETQATEFKAEACLHLAWEGIPDYGFEKSFKNLETGARLVQVLSTLGCRHFVVSGSCWEYGRVSGMVTEEIVSMEPGIFASAKLGLHQIASALCRTNGVSLAWGRVFYPYGPYQKRVSLVPSVCSAIIEGRDLVLKTPGAANDFLFVDDTAAALVLLLEKKADGLYNIGSGSATTVGHLADSLLKLAGCPILFGENASLPGPSFWADMTKLRSLGWEPQTSLDEGLKRTLEFYRG